MHTFLAITSSAILVFAAVIVALNWGYVIANYLAQRQGRESRISLVHAAPQLLVLIAAILSLRAGLPLPSWVLWLVALADPGLFQILVRPFSLLRQKTRAQT